MRKITFPENIWLDFIKTHAFNLSAANPLKSIQEPLKGKDQKPEDNSITPRSNLSKLSIFVEKPRESIKEQKSTEEDKIYKPLKKPKENIITATIKYIEVFINSLDNNETVRISLLKLRKNLLLVNAFFSNKEKIDSKHPYYKNFIDVFEQIVFLKSKLYSQAIVIETSQEITDKLPDIQKTILEAFHDTIQEYINKQCTLCPDKNEFMPLLSMFKKRLVSPTFEIFINMESIWALLVGFPTIEGIFKDLIINNEETAEIKKESTETTLDVIRAH